MTAPTAPIGELRLGTELLPVGSVDREREPAGSGVTRRATPWLLVALVVAGAVLRLWALGAQRLGYDEAFTAMAGRLSPGGLFEYLRVHDSHPPLDYLLHAPLASLGANELLFRLPGALCSIGALALFAWWMRRYGLAGVVAVGLFAFSAFELRHGRTARMYADLELLGVATAFLADTWLRRSRRWHAPVLAALVLVGLLTHVSMFVFASGLFLLAGTRRDREAWRWRAAIVAAGLGWAVLWGSSFLVQTSGGHSDWIPRTTLDRIVHVFGSLVTHEPGLHLFALVAVVAGAVVVARRDRPLARVLVCCAFVPAALAALFGAVAPVLIDRTLTLGAWAPCLAIGFLVGGIAVRSKLFAVVAVLVLAVVVVPAGLNVISAPSVPDAALRHLEHVVRPGDVVAIRPGGKLPEVAWSLGVRGGTSFQVVPVQGLGRSAGFVLGSGPRTGRTWLLDWHRRRPLPLTAQSSCARAWVRRSSRVLCFH
jgi:hypothetical protein